MKAKTEAQERIAAWGYEECAGYDTGPVTLIRRIREGARSLQVRRVQRECFTRIKTTDRYRMWSRQRRLSYIFDTIENFLHRAFTLMSAVA